MARLSLSFLGTFRVTLGGTPLKGFKSNKVRALLAYLSVESARPHSRQSLEAMLWPELPDQAAGAALRNSLSNLRHLLSDTLYSEIPPFLLVTRETVQFNRDSDYWLDVEAFKNQIATVKSKTNSIANQGEMVNALNSAAALYQGDFLEGFFVADSIPFEEWLMIRSEAYHAQVVTALQQLGGLYIDQGEFLKAGQIARRQIELEPYSEIAYRQLMYSLAMAGQRAEALRQYDSVSRLLANELQASPEQETIRLYEKIRSDEVSALPLVTIPLPSLTPPPPFVARESQLTQLDRYLAEALAQRGRVAFIVGEPGSGKTTLMDEFSRGAMLSNPNLVAAFGSCAARSSLSSPYLPFVDILNMLSGDIEGRRASGTITPEHAQRLWTIWPDTIHALLQYCPGLIGSLLPLEPLMARVEAFVPPGADWKASLDQIAHSRSSKVSRGSNPQVDIFAQVTNLLHELARHVALLLIIDDLQWADASSLSLLFHIGRRLAGRQILILGAYRLDDTEPVEITDDRLNLQGIVNEFQRDFGDLIIDLDRADGRAFIDAFLDMEPNQFDRSFRQTLYQHTEGNPLFTIELFRSMQERSQIEQNTEGKKIATSSLDWGKVPARVEGVIAERVRRLPNNHRKLLEAASVEGEVFTAELAARLVDITEDESRRLLSTAIARQARIVRADSIQRFGNWRFSRYRFRHILYQKYIYAQMDPIERTELHQKAAETLEEFFEKIKSQKIGLDYPSISYHVQLAWHFEQAGLIERAVNYLRLAGETAVQVSANYEAASFFEHGISLIKLLPETRARFMLELDLLINLFVPLMGIYGWSAIEQTRVYERVLDISRKIGSKTDDIQFFRPLVTLALHHFTGGEFQEASVLGEQLLSLSKFTGDPNDKVVAHWILGQVYTFLGDLPLAEDHLKQALELYDPDSFRSLMVSTGIDLGISIQGFQATVGWLQGFPARAWQATQDLLKDIQSLSHPMTWYYALDTIIAFLTMMIQGSLVTLPLAEAPALVSGEEYRSEYDLAFFHFYTTALNGFILVEQGYVTEGIALMQGSLDHLQFHGLQAGGQILYYLLAIAYLKDNQMNLALAIVDKRLTLLNKFSSHLFLPGFNLLKAEILFHMAQAATSSQEQVSDYNQAEESFLKAIEVSQRQGMKSWELKATISLVRFWQHRQDEGSSEKVVTAMTMLKELYAWFIEGFDLPDLVQARVLLESWGNAKKVDRDN